MIPLNLGVFSNDESWRFFERWILAFFRTMSEYQKPLVPHICVPLRQTAGEKKPLMKPSPVSWNFHKGRVEFYNKKSDRLSIKISFVSLGSSCWFQFFGSSQARNLLYPIFILVSKYFFPWFLNRFDSFQTFLDSQITGLRANEGNIYIFSL